MIGRGREIHGRCIEIQGDVGGEEVREGDGRVKWRREFRSLESRAALIHGAEEEGDTAFEGSFEKGLFVSSYIAAKGH